METLSMKKLFETHRICAILRGLPPDLAVEYGEALYQGGIRLFEVALNTPGACGQIRQLADRLGKDAVVGAGTAVTVEKAEQALEAGARFLLTPSAGAEVLKYCRDHSIPLLPGVMTPTDVDLCVSHGFTTLKLFPAGDLPMSYIKSLKGPFDGTDYVAVGGVGPDNIAEFFRRGFVGAGMGSNLVPKEYVSAGLWTKAAEHVGLLLRRVGGRALKP